MDEPFSFLKLTSDKNQLKIILQANSYKTLTHKTNYRKILRFFSKVKPLPKVNLSLGYVNY